MSAISLQIGKSALQTSTAAINVAGENISNATTEGYSRKSISTSATTAIKSSSYYSGTGVQVDSVNRVISSYYKEAVQTCSSNSAYASNLVETYTALENSFNALTDTDFSSELSNFWSALNDLSLDTSDEELATIAIQEAKSLTATINDIDESLITIHNDLNDQIESDVDSINLLTQQIAKLNEEIMSNEACGSGNLQANDLRDQRDELVKDLQTICDITVVEENNGSYSIYNNSNSLVYRDSYYELGIEYEYEDGLKYSQPVFADGNVAIESESGSLGANLYLRDEVITDYQDSLDTLAGNVIWQINSVYSQGVGNSGYTDLTGTTCIEDPSVTLNNLDYGVETVDGTYEITNGSFELLIYNTETGCESTVIIDVDLDGNTENADTILYDRSDPTAENSLINIIQTKLDSDFPDAYSVSLNNNNQLVIESNSDIYELGFGNDTSGVVNALGLNNLFTGYDAGSISVNSILEENPQYFATSSSFTSDDNEVINTLLELQEETLMPGGTQTIDSFYCTLMSRLGIESADAQSQSELAEDLLLQSETNNESISGVSIDEELIALMNYQKAYQAAAEFITVIDECMQTILEM